MIGLFPPSPLPFPAHLTTFVLNDIDLSLPPEVLLGHLGNIRYLNVGFLSSVPHPHGEDRRGLRAATTRLNRVMLSNLGSSYFHGVCAYLEALITQKDTPRIHDTCFTLFHQLFRAFPHVSADSGSTESRSTFYPRGAVISAALALQPSAGEKLAIWLPCRRLDYQVASVMQICSALTPNFANMEDLFIKYHQGQLPVEWHDEVDPNLWSEIIAQFHSMKTLWISSALISGVTQAIRFSAQRLACGRLGTRGKMEKSVMSVIYCLLKYLCHSFLIAPMLNRRIVSCYFLLPYFLLQSQVVWVSCNRQSSQQSSYILWSSRRTLHW
jgi:hypothetical protein